MMRTYHDRATAPQVAGRRGTPPVFQPLLFQIAEQFLKNAGTRAAEFINRRRSFDNVTYRRS